MAVLTIKEVVEGATKELQKAVDEAFGKTECWHEFNGASGRYRWELWDDGWRMYRINRSNDNDGWLEVLQTRMTDEEMMGSIKLLRS